MSTSLKIMSFNMRFDTPADKNNSFQSRKGRIADFLNEERADIIGFQEITPAMRDWLVDTLSDYYTVGVGRAEDYSGETALIAFRKDTMALKSCDTVMLSTTPEIFGSRYDGSDQSPCPREYVRVCLKHRDIADPFYVYNVHTDHRGQIARMLAVSQIMRDIASRREKFFLTGDFNALPEAPEISMITSCASRPVIDATASLGGTFHDFGRLDCPQKIDYIFTDATIKIRECARVQDEPLENRTYISDHNPIYIIAEL